MEKEIKEVKEVNEVNKSDIIKKYINIQNISNEDLIEFIKFEEELRYSEHFQKLYVQKNIYNDSIFQKINIEDIIQLNVLDKFDYEICEENLYALRYLCSIHYKDKNKFDSYTQFFKK